MPGVFRTPSVAMKDDGSNSSSPEGSCTSSGLDIVKPVESLNHTLDLTPPFHMVVNEHVLRERMAMWTKAIPVKKKTNHDELLDLVKAQVMDDFSSHVHTWKED